MTDQGSSSGLQQRRKGNGNSKITKGKTIEIVEEKPPSLFSRAFQRDLTWEKEDIQDVVHWLRQIIALIVGIIWGLIPLKGITAIFGFGAIEIGGVFMYYTRYLNIDDEDLLSKASLTNEGLATSFATFLIAWIFTYNFFHI